MATYNSFEDIEVWKSSVDLAVKVYTLCNQSGIAKDLEMKNQIKKAAVSISSNIAEGFEYDNRKDFIRFLRIAKGSAGEVRSQIILSFKVSLISEQQFKELNADCLSVSKQLKGFISYLSKYQSSPK